MIPTHTIALPEYTVDAEPDHLAIGHKLDAFVAKALDPGRYAIRAISLQDHPGQTVDRLIAAITELGTDRYDPARVPVLHDYYGPQGVELHAIPCTVGPTGLSSTHADSGSTMGDFVSDFFHGPPVDRGGVPLRLDLLICYDLEQLDGIRTDELESQETTAFRFKDPGNKPAALRAFVVIGR
ncbi:hypothetical protein [Flindersiella endophytica]